VACAGFAFDGEGCSDGHPYCSKQCLVSLSVLLRCETTYAGVEGEVGESAMRKQTGLVLRHPIANLLVDGRGGALEWAEVVQLAERDGIPNPGEELLIRNNPHCGINKSDLLSLLVKAIILTHHCPAPAPNQGTG
jgi:hypothetical protein